MNNRIITIPPGNLIRSLFSSTRAFSLIEVVLAVGAAVFALITIMALLPVGIRMTGDSAEESRAVDISSSIVADFQMTGITNQLSPRYRLPLPNLGGTVKTNYFGINEENQSTGTDLSNARYRVDYAITPPLNGGRGPYFLHLKIGWPALSADPLGKLEMVASLPQP